MEVPLPLKTVINHDIVVAQKRCAKQSAVSLLASKLEFPHGPQTSKQQFYSFTYQTM